MSSSQHPEDPAGQSPEPAATAAPVDTADTASTAEPADTVEPGDTTQATGLLPPTHWTQLAEQVGDRHGRIAEPGGSCAVPLRSGLAKSRRRRRFGIRGYGQLDRLYNLEHP